MDRNNIYGHDDNSFAEGIASDALSNTSGKEDVWGARFDQSAVSKGETADKGEARAIGNKSDSRAKTKGN